MALQFSISLDDVTAASRRIAHYVKRTPLIRSSYLSDRLGTNIYLKQEILQKTGAFKVRGAFNKMLTLTESERRSGVVAVSGGNHAQAVAYAARTLGLKAVICMPENTPRNYLEATRGYGAQVALVPTVWDAFAEADRLTKLGWANVHPFNDPLVMAGQGTVGLEITEDVPELTDAIVSIGGGGFMGGVATAIKGRLPQARIWGVETEGADCMARALAAGHVVEMPAITSIAKTLGAPAASAETLELARRYLESVTVVSDREALDALVLILERTKLLTEPAASCTLAAADRLKQNFGPDHHVVLILCGGNIGVSDLCHYIESLGI
jgi:threonine dehydratase